MDKDSELQRRMGLWDELGRQNLGELEPALLRRLRVYGGAQGIWVDKANTGGSPRMGRAPRLAFFTPGGITRTTFRKTE
jgi:hypothetical protein